MVIKSEESDERIGRNCLGLSCGLEGGKSKTQNMTVREKTMRQISPRSENSMLAKGKQKDNRWGGQVKEGKRKGRK
jgi:hypothetical protein